jgi:coenzyme F420 hydrogenase subunit beta
LASAAEEYDMKRIAVVGTPCQIEAVRKMQFSSRGVRKLGCKVALTVGLFCRESFWYNGLINKYLVEEKGLDLSKITKFKKTEDRFIVQTNDGEMINVPITEIKPYVRENCSSCGDLTAEYADISIGADGSPEGWSTVIVRTEAGKKLFDEAVKANLLEYNPIEKVKPGLEVVKKFTKEKRKKSAAT